MIRPQYALLCEFHRPGEKGKVDLLGLIDRIWAPGVPAQHPRLTFVALVVTDTEDGLGRHTAKLRCFLPSGGVMFEQQVGFDMKPDAGTWLGSARLAFEINNIPLPEYGKYFFRLLVDEREVADHPMSVVKPTR